MDALEQQVDAASGCRGFTLLELILTLVLVPIVLGMGYMAMKSGSAVGNDVVEATSSQDKLRAAMRRIGDELLCSTKVGEDANGNGVLDAGEDINGNGRLEKDWNVTGTSIRFNRVLPDGTYSLPITYAWTNGELRRSQMVAGGATRTSILTSRVLAFSVLVSGPQLTVSMSVGTAAAPQTTSISVQQRN